MRKFLVGLIHHIFQLLFVVVIALTGILLWLQSPPGSQWALQKLLTEANSAQSDYVITAKGLGTGWPFYVSLREIDVADADGPLASLRDVRLLWSPLQLLDNHINISRLTARSATLYRYPAAKEDANTGPQPESTYDPEVAIGLVGVETLLLPDVPHPIKADIALAGTLKKLVLTLREVAMEPVDLVLHGELDLSTKPLPAGQIGFAVNDLTRAGVLYNQPVSGGIEGAVVIDGNGLNVTAAGDELTYGANRISKLQLASTIAMNDGITEGDVKLEAALDDQPLSLTTRFSANSESVSLQDINGTSPFARLSGNFGYRPDNKTMSGRLALQADDLSTLNSLTGQQLAGRASLVAEPQGDGSKLGWQIDLDLASPVVLAAKSHGALAFADGQTVLDIAALDGRYEQEALRLTKPVSLTVAGNSFTLSALSLMYGKTALYAEGLWQPDSLKGNASWQNLSIPGLTQLGDIKGRIEFAGTPTAPELRGNTTLVPAMPQPALINADFSYSNNKADITATYTQDRQQLLAANATLGAPLDLTKPDIAAWMNAPLSGKANGRLALDWLAKQDLFELPLKQGDVTLDVTLAGTVSVPEVNGNAALDKGYYISPATGTELHNLQAAASFAGQKVNLTRLSATDGRNGTLSGSGSMMGDGTALDMKIDNFLLVRLPEARAIASAELQLSGPSFTALQLTGNVHIAEAQLRIPERLPVSLIRLPVEQRGDGPRQPLQQEESGTPFVMGLDLKVDALNQIRLEGRGLQSELAGNLAIAGNTADPAITGYFKLVRGSFDFLGKRFQLSEGQVSFDGGELSNPSLNLVAEQEGNGITTKILIRGTGQKPDISYSSTPELPQDEIIARLLFGRSVTQLSALQAVQLARAIASLASGDSGFDLTGDIRRGLGLDQLDVVSDGDGSDAAGGSALEVGKYLTDDVYISTRQGLTPESRRVGVEIRLTPQLSLQSDTGMENSGNVQLKFQRDY